MKRKSPTKLELFGGSQSILWLMSEVTSRYLVAKGLKGRTILTLE